MQTLTLDPAMRLFVLCASVLVTKMLLTGYATSLARNLKGVYVSPEDYAWFGRAPGAPDEQVERLRRAHRNDLEEILPFLAIAFLGVHTGAVGYEWARWLFPTFTAVRVLHTIVYGLGLQPWRSILFGIGDVTLLITTLLVAVDVLR